MINADSSRGKSKKFDLLFEDKWINQCPGGNEQAGVRIDKTRGQLAKNDVLAVVVDKGVAGIRSATPDTNVDVFLLGDEGRDLPLAFRAILTADDNPKTHDWPSFRKVRIASSTAAYRSCSERSL